MRVTTEVDKIGQVGIPKLDIRNLMMLTILGSLNDLMMGLRYDRESDGMSPTGPQGIVVFWPIFDRGVVPTRSPIQLILSVRTKSIDALSI